MMHHKRLVAVLPRTIWERLHGTSPQCYWCVYVAVYSHIVIISELHNSKLCTLAPEM